MVDSRAKPLELVTRSLVDVSMGRRMPECILTHADLLDVYSQRILPDREIWIWGGRIAAIKPGGAFSGLRGGRCRIHDAQGGYLAPGLVDPHVHVESSMVSISAYAEAALRNGTTTIVCDPHEIANVCDAEGVKWMAEDARRAKLNALITIPSTVPATWPVIETTGGNITARKLGCLLDLLPEAVGEGEKMDYAAIAASDPRCHALIAEALRRRRPVSGHVYGREYVGPCAAAGVTDTHESVDPDLAESVLESGMWLLVRGGPPDSPWDSLPAVIRVVTERNCSTHRICFCTDDRDPADLLEFGLDYVVRSAIRCGVRPATAWAMGSLNPALRFGLDGDIGGLGPGRRADVVLLDRGFRVQEAWLAGHHVIHSGEPTDGLEKALDHRYSYPGAARRTVRIQSRGPLIPEIPRAPCDLHAIRVTSDIVTEHLEIHYSGREPLSTFLTENDLCYVTVIERHGVTGGRAHGLLQGFGIRRGAVASSVGHDAHNVVVAGTLEKDMGAALDSIVEEGGGLSVVAEGRVLGKVSLPVAGLMSDQRIGVVAREMRLLKRAWESLGCRLPYMGFNLISLAVIPEFRITDKGLVKVPELEILPLMEST